MKKIKNKIIYIFILIMVSIPFFVQAWSMGDELVPCKPTVGDDGQMTNSCTFSSLVTLANNIIDFIVLISVSVSAIMFAYAGWLYITAQGDPGKIKSAHGIFKNVGLGLVFVLGAWLIVEAVLSGMGLESGYSLLS